MRRAILTDTDSAAGSVKQARLAELVSAPAFDLIDLPAPDVGDVTAFFEERHRILAARSDFEPDIFPGPDTGQYLLRFLDEAAQHDRLELWFSPSLGAQLDLCFVVSAVAKRPLLANKTFIASLNMKLGEQFPQQIAALKPDFLPLTPDVCALADRTTHAFRAPTPETWRKLIDTDLSALPHLPAEAPCLLAELPDARNGLSATQLALLRLIEQEHAKLIEVLGEAHARRASPFSYWRLGAILLDLFAAPTPAATGTSERAFDLSLHDDRARHDAFIHSVPCLTLFGRALLKGEADWTGANPIDRWLGGTHVAQSSLWRWDDAARRLMAPA